MSSMLSSPFAPAGVRLVLAATVLLTSLFAILVVAHILITPEGALWWNGLRS